MRGHRASARRSDSSSGLFQKVPSVRRGRHSISWDETSTAIALTTFTEGQRSEKNSACLQTKPRARHGLAIKTGQEGPHKRTNRTVTGPQSRKQRHNGPAGSQRPRKNAMLETMQLRACHARVRYVRNPLHCNLYTRSHLESIAPFTSNTCCWV